MKIQSYFAGLWQLVILVVILLTVVACATSGTGATSAPVEATSTPAGSDSSLASDPQPATATSPVSPTPTVSPIPLEALTSELQTMVNSALPPTPTPDSSGYSGPGIEGVSVVTLTNTIDEQPLWAAFSYGMRNFDPQQNHFVAIYSHNEEGWQELGRQELAEVDYLDQASVEQVQLEPDHVWLQVQGGAGAHSGVFGLLQFDGQTLEPVVSHFSSSPGGSRLEDLNNDGTLDVVLDATDYYVFCYACGVRFIQYQVLHWDGAQLSEVNLVSLPESAPAELRQLNNQAVVLAQARLLQKAGAMIEQAQALDEQAPTITWNAALINLPLNEQSEQASTGPYPLLENIFYGNYEASLEVMRAYRPEEIFSQPTPLITGAVAEGWEEALSEWILDLTNQAIEVEPELAPAYFLRGWARFLVESASPDVLADVQRAAELDPQDALFSDSLEYLK